MPEWFSVTTVSAHDVPHDVDETSPDEALPQDVSGHSGASAAGDVIAATQRSPDEPKQRARYSTRWPAGIPEGEGPEPPDDTARLSVNQWVLLISLGVIVFVGAALATGLVIGRVLRDPRAPRASAAVPAGSTLASAQLQTASGRDRVDPRSVSDGRESGVSSLLDAGPGSGDRAPGFQLETLEGDVLSLAALEGRVVVVNFWATWCNWCKYELPALQVVHEKYKDEGLIVLGVDVEEPGPLVEAYAERYGLSFPIVLDVEGTAAEAYKVRGLPMTFFIDRSGTIVRVKRGAMREDELELHVRNALAGD
ncbi:MAG: Thiol-disulfide oxidoreductase ResA [Anaerolineales bacterium]|nr:Thiol-disulfide oxidoreductase ResA [Anaerolineales bacterium]